MQLTAHDIDRLKYSVAYARDENAYKQLFIFFHPQLFRFACHITADRELSEEIVSDVMMRIWEMETRLIDVENLRLYLFRAIKNASLTHLNTRKIDFVEMENSLFNLATSNTPEQGLLNLELKDRIERAIQSLPPKCQCVFRLIKEEGFSYKHTSSILGISPNTIENHMALAFKKISHYLYGYLNKDI